MFCQCGDIVLRRGDRVDETPHSRYIIEPGECDIFADGDFMEDGKLNTTNQKGLQVEIVDEEFAFFSCLISGFETGKYNALELVMAGYAYTTKGEEKSEMSYFQKEYTPDTDDTTDDVPYSSEIVRNATTLSAVTIVNVKAFHEYEESIKP